MLIVCLFLSLSLAVAALLVLHLRRQLRGARELLHRVLRKEFINRAEDD